MSNITSIPSGGDDSQYGYTPSHSIGILFVVLFGLSTILHAGQATYYRMWWLFPTACLCGVGELLGWSGRLWSSSYPSLDDPYMMQITATIISPTPLIAVNFVLLSRIVQRLGVCYSRVSARWYTIIFLSCDIVALVIQGAGGGLAATADDRAGTQMGANIMLAGIAFQFAAIVMYTLCALEFLRRYTRDLPVGGTAPLGAGKPPLTLRLRLMISALAFSTLVLFIRSVYRIVELSGGWNGPVIQTEVYFNVLDGGMVVLAIFTMNFAHPGLLLGTDVADGVAEKQVESMASTGTLTA
ncbi:RTA1 like protein-domain-containing protein [Mycena rosella]|uniref:RTA1 like protein-domain-containing protein n=1 Tax=Mycena rosella TaxID=1033263 RepID=A0AAD7DFU9_MYCRO|nr:RTA1 like protein-domain-containing protein [Mycena rosella]